LTLGNNNQAGLRLADFIERIERVRAEKKQLALDEGAILAEAKAEGYHPGPMRAVLKIRAMKPHERAEAETLLDTYLHAMGMASEPPLRRAIGQLGVDILSRDSVVEAMKPLVPDHGSITIETKEGLPVRLTRDKDGEVHETEVVERPAPAAASGPRPAPVKADVPDVDAEGAEVLGRMAFKADTAIIANPFPFGDARRGRWDAGWRKESGGDGMGPDRGDD
jgi:uncharacterized protein (UPF0335 family)